MKQVAAIDRHWAHTGLKHRGGGTATENMSILLFRGKKRRWGALLEDWKQINVCYRPRQAGPLNCSGRVEQNKGKKPTNKLSLGFMLIDEPPRWLLLSFSVVLVFGLHCVRVGLGPFQAQMVKSFWCLLTLYIYNDKNEIFSWNKGPSFIIHCSVTYHKAPIDFEITTLPLHNTT